MKNTLHFACLILILSIFGCVNNAQDTTADEQEPYQPIDVYQNPNDFNNYPKLLLGDIPPKLNIDRWFNGEGFTNYQPGKVYIIEFFASWCQPCRKSIPHLNNLQQQYINDLVVVGIAAAENEPNTVKLEKMINAKKLGLSYLVGYTNKEKTFKDWMWGARNTGLPWAFIIDKKGKLAWYGQPFDSRFEQVLEEVIEDKFDYQAIDKSINTLLKNRAVLWDIQSNFWNALEKEEWQEAVDLGQKLLDSNDESFYYETAKVSVIYYENLNDKESANKWIERLMNGYHQNVPEALKLIADLYYNNGEFQVGLPFIEQADQLTSSQNPQILLLLAQYHSALGNEGKSQATLEMALKFNDLPELEEEITEMLNR